MIGTFARAATISVSGSRPAACAASRKPVVNPNSTSIDRAMGFNPSAIRAARCTPPGVIDPSRTGMWACTGLGFTSDGAMR